MVDNNEVHMSTEALEDMVGHPLRRSSDTKTLDLHANVGRLEQSIENTNVALRDFASRTTSDITRLTKSIDETNRNQLIGKQTNWGMIASWVGVLVLLLGLVVYQPLQEIRTSVNSHKQDGHPTSVITRIEENESKFTAVISRLQREITLLEKADEDRHDEYSKRLEKVESWVIDHTSSSPAAHAVFEEQISELKKQVQSLFSGESADSKLITSLKERVLDVEREIYSGATYRSGRPIKPPIKQGK